MSIDTMTIKYLHRTVQNNIERDVEVAHSTVGLPAAQIPRVGDQITFVLDEGETLSGEVTRVHWVMSNLTMNVVVRFG